MVEQMTLVSTLMSAERPAPRPAQTDQPAYHAQQHDATRLRTRLAGQRDDLLSERDEAAEALACALRERERGVPNLMWGVLAARLEALEVAVAAMEAELSRL
jgi:hypothetical protein